MATSVTGTLITTRRCRRGRARGVTNRSLAASGKVMAQSSGMWWREPQYNVARGREGLNISFTDHLAKHGRRRGRDYNRRSYRHILTEIEEDADHVHRAREPPDRSQRAEHGLRPVVERALLRSAVVAVPDALRRSGARSARRLRVRFAWPSRSFPSADLEAVPGIEDPGRRGVRARRGHPRPGVRGHRVWSGGRDGAG